MPIFQDDFDLDNSHDQQYAYDNVRPLAPERIAIDPPSPKLRRLSEESLRTELCEGPVPDSPRRPATPHCEDEDDTTISDRAELIERLKRGESPTWAPSRRLESILNSSSSTHAPKSARTSPDSSILLPPAQITPEKAKPESPVDERLRNGLEIERPRSALHSGDFTHDEVAHGENNGDGSRQQFDTHLASESTWITTSPPRDFTPFHFTRRIPFTESAGSFRSAASPLSSSISSSFAYQAPTSPLVQSESNEDYDMNMPLEGLDMTQGRFQSRRHTLNSTSSSLFGSPSPRGFAPLRLPLHRREGSIPSQAHQPRRSLTAAPSFMQRGLSPQTPAYLRSRRMSIGSDSSPIQHASMVGSYEESILRGRMSTTPSKPLDFLAQIGVLGKGKCKSSLRCPPHVTLPFPAVYYSYSSTPHGRSRSDDGPSPYVGQIDLENGLPNLNDESRARRKVQSRYDRRATDGDIDLLIPSQESDLERRTTARPKRRRSGSPKAPPGGSYRIPEKGQIQIIIKNQNKTAVKLFLVPYDLTGMEPGTKTFIRQRLYSAGPIIDGVPGASEAGSSDRPILRYLAHLHICCPAKKRFYLYKSVRIVFANRVPDGKEKLRNETTWPEPRYTSYKPVRVMHPPLSMPSGPGAMLAAQKALNRRSLGVSVGVSSHAFDMMDDVYPAPQRSSERPSSVYNTSTGGGGNTLPLDPIPFHLPSTARFDSEPSETDTTDATGAEIRSPDSSQASRPSTKDSPGMAPWGAARYEKLSKGDSGYGGQAFGGSANGFPGGHEGLLSQRLRTLGVQTASLTESERQDEMS